METIAPSRSWLRAEVLIVLALSLGRSAVYSLLSLVRALASVPRSGQSTALNSSLQEKPWLDLLYQLLAIALTLTPAALVVLLLALTAGSLRQAPRDLGLAPRRRLR